MGKRLEYPTWLIPVDSTAKKRLTSWVCVCNSCQCERPITYSQAFNIIKGICKRECDPCAWELGLRNVNKEGLKLGYLPENQAKAVTNRTGYKRPKMIKVMEYQWPFSPEKFVTEKGRQKQRAAKLGKRGPETSGWEGGKTSERRAIMARDDYKQLRRSIFVRDNFSCQICKVRGGNLELDHFKEWCNYPELRFEPTNLRTLCKPCHTQTPNYLYKAKKVKKINGL